MVKFNESMINIIKKQTGKFGNWIKKDGVEVQCNLKVFSEKVYLNYIFSPLKLETRQKFDSAHKKFLKCTFSKELEELYLICNGFSLFSDSLVFFGVGLETIDGYLCKDFCQYNNWLINSEFSSKYINLYAFGYYSFSYFCMDKEKPNEIYVINRNTLEIEHTFKSIKETYLYYMDKLADKYDNKGLKIDFDKTQKRILIRNRTTEKL